MRVSLNTIKQFTDVDLSIDELLAKINGQLGGVEEVTDLAKRYEGAIIAKVVSCEKHPNADKLSVCHIDAGAGENVRVVCGAPNVREGLFVVWLQPGSTVPSSFNDKEPFVLGARELRGVMSNGMLASSKELGIGDSHNGILEINPDEWKPSDIKIEPGVSFAKAFGLNDTTIDIENKMFTHRPDLFGQIGVAREIAGIQNTAFTSPKWYSQDAATPEPGPDSLPLLVTNEAKQVVPRLMAVAIKGVTVKPSPLWLQCELVRLGGKPINNIVDVTNYVMLLTAQPTHAYDYDKLRGSTLGARMAHAKETVSLLNGKTYTLTPDDIVIVDGEGAVGLAGIMGGGNSEVSSDTKNIVLEVANFDMYAVRKSSMRHGLFTDALTRFNKGQSRLQNPVVMKLLITSIFDVTSGSLASAIFDESDDLPEHSGQFISPTFINERLGLALERADIERLLENVEFEICKDCDDERSKQEIHYTAPFWRTDIELPEDIVEEVGRLYGFDKLPRELPQRSITPALTNPVLDLKQAVRRSLSAAGANEVLTYSFVHEKLLERAGQRPDEAFKLSNALSPDLQYYRLSLLPSLLDKVKGNSMNGFDEFTLFEIGKAHNKHALQEDGLPAETGLLELVYSSKKPNDGAPYYKMRRLIERLYLELGIDVTFAAIDQEMDYAGMAPFEQSRSSLVMSQAGEILGIVGELKQSVRSGFKLPDYVAAASLSLDVLLYEWQHTENTYRPLSKFPSVTQDVSLKVRATVSYAQLLNSIMKSIAELDESVMISTEPISIYSAGNDGYKTISLRLTVTSHKATLTDEAVQVMIKTIADNAKRDVSAEQV